MATVIRIVLALLCALAAIVGGALLLLTHGGALAMLAFIAGMSAALLVMP